MAPRPPLADTVKLEITYTGPDNAVANNICYALSTANISDSTSLATVAQNLFTQLQDTIGNFRPIWSASWTITGVTASDYSGASEAFGRFTGSVVGSLAGSPTAAQTCMVLGWTIAARYRGGHPRWYIPGVMPAIMSVPGGRHLAAPQAASLQAFGNAIITGFNATHVGSLPLTLGTISFQTGHASRPSPLFRPFVGAQVNTRLGTQRRRLGRETPTH